MVTSSYRYKARSKMATGRSVFRSYHGWKELYYMAANSCTVSGRCLRLAEQVAAQLDSDI